MLIILSVAKKTLLSNEASVLILSSDKLTVLKLDLWQGKFAP
jgi:hypothetical protein